MPGLSLYPQHVSIDVGKGMPLTMIGEDSPDAITIRFGFYRVFQTFNQIVQDSKPAQWAFSSFRKVLLQRTTLRAAPKRRGATGQGPTQLLGKRSLAENGFACENDQNF
jgi:hypothetical protein